MRKLLILLLIFTLCCPCAAAVEKPNFLALAFDGYPQKEAQTLFEGLDTRNARASFFLRAEECGHSPEILAHGHEIGIFSRARQGMSRREIAREITELRSMLDCRVRFLRLGGESFDALRQVARAMGLAILEPSLDPWADAPPDRSVLERVKDGDVLLLDAGVQVDTALNLIDLLQKRGFILVTLSELARLRGAFPEPGERVKGFPETE